MYTIVNNCNIDLGVTYRDHFFTYLWENTQDIVFCVNSRGNICCANRQALHTFGLEEKEILRMPVDDLKIMQKDEQSFNWRGMFSTSDTTLQENLALSCQPSDARQIHFRATLHRLSIDQENYLFCMLSDATLQAKKDHLHQVLKEKLHNMFYLSPCAVCVTGVKDGKIYEVNESFLHLSGYTEKELIGNNTFGLGIWKRLEDRQKLIHMLEEQGEGQMETVFVGKAGREVEGEVNARMVRTYEEQCFISVVRDIGSAKAAEKALKQSEQTLDLVSRATNDAIWDWDLQGGRVWHNDIINIFGYSKEDIGDTIDWWISKIHADDRERVVTRLYSFIDQRIEKWFDKYRFERKDHSYAYVYDKGHILLNEEDKPYRFIGGIVDITQRVMAEESLLIKNKQIAEYAFFNSHKIRGPLARLMGLIDLINYAAEPEDCKNEQLLEKLKAVAEEIDELIKDASRMFY